MELVAHISHREYHSETKVVLMRILRYLQTGYLLHLMALASVFLCYYLGKEFLILWEDHSGFWKLFLYGYGSAYFFTLIFFSQFDARSRYQNYKLVKDKFYEYGFDRRFLKPFVYSRCQRDAIQVAAAELNYYSEWRKLVHVWGFRWYHILPHIVVRSPKVLFTKDYWSKTLFVKTYHLKHFLW